MSKIVEKILLFLTDFLTINGTFFIWCQIRKSEGFFSPNSIANELMLSLFVFGFWFLLFLFLGLYHYHYALSRIDEFIAVIKAVSVGVIVIFLVTFNLEKDLLHPFTLSRLMILSYWVMMVLFVGMGRVLLRSIHRKLLEIGVGRHRAFIVGWGRKAEDLYDRIIQAPALGYDIVGFVTQKEEDLNLTDRDVPIKGTLDQLGFLLRREQIHDVLIALPRRSERALEEVIGQCGGTPVGMKIVPDLYDVIIGRVKTNQIYGFPLIEILPQLMAPWEQVVKRLIDIILSLMILIAFFPIWLLVALAIKMDTRGPIFYVQKRVGKNGGIYSMIKFRSMVVGAEKMTGPVWATWNDPRVTRVGRFIRRLRLDEVPQFLNVLSGQMSLVGPRPERPYFVQKFKEAIPLYARRLRIQPGITGWAQVKGHYDQSIEHVKQKLQFDLFYLENMSLRMDLKIIFHTLYVMLGRKGH